QRAPCEGEIEVVGVTVDGGDEGATALDAGSIEHPVVGGVAKHGRVWHLGDALSVAVDDHQLLFGRQVLGDGTADASPAADNDVTAHARDLPFHATPPIQVAQLTLDDRLEHHA